MCCRLMQGKWCFEGHKIKFFTVALPKTETAQGLTCHYYLFSQIVSLKEHHEECTFFSFSAASGSSHEELRTFYCC